MDYSMVRESLAVCKTIFEGCQEQPVDLDFNLPDYCPDIQKILKCHVYPGINMKNISGDRLDIDGTAVVKLLYLDSERMKVRCCEYTSPFSCSFNLKETPQNAIAHTKVKVEYINCRALSSRRLDIRGAFSVCAKVVEKSSKEIVSGIEENDIQQKKISVPASDVAGTGQQLFTVNEILEISSGKPQAESVIKSDVCVMVDSYKMIANKIVLKAEAHLKILYMSNIEEGTLDTMEYSIPISQIVDVEGVNDECICDVKLDVLTHDVRVKSDDSEEESNLIELDIRLCATAIAYNQVKLNLITDVYSTNYNVEADYKTTDIMYMVDEISDTYSSKNTIDLPESGISSVLDVWNDMISVSAKNEGDNILFKGKINICILASDNEGTPFYIERLFDFECSRNWTDKDQNISCDADAFMNSMSYRITNSNSVEVKTEIKLRCKICTNKNYRLVENLSADETTAKPKDKMAAITIYYADEGENIWDIARKYSTSVDAIKSENDLTEDILEERGMILIPM